MNDINSTETKLDTRKLNLLEELEKQPEVKQKDLAKRLGIAAGTVNWLIKHLSKKGYIKVKRIGQWRWRYILTPSGFAEKARLTRRYIQNSMELYRKTRQEARQLIAKLHKEGYDSVRLEGDSRNDLMDVCRLTCLEEGIEVFELKQDNTDNPNDEHDQLPILKIKGRVLSIKWPEQGGNTN